MNKSVMMLVVQLKERDKIRRAGGMN